MLKSRSVWWVVDFEWYGTCMASIYLPAVYYHLNLDDTKDSLLVGGPSCCSATFTMATTHNFLFIKIVLFLRFWRNCDPFSNSPHPLPRSFLLVLAWWDCDWSPGVTMATFRYPGEGPHPGVHISYLEGWLGSANTDFSLPSPVQNDEKTTIANRGTVVYSSTLVLFAYNYNKVMG